MAIRFQVDADFYDHPKTIGMSDSATALWVRAGSYSAGKLSDGFIADAALSLLSRCPEEAANELVERGLWRRVRGGFRFHQWDRRNLLRARVEAERESDRQRKRRERQTAGPKGTAQVNGHIVRPDGGPDSERSPPGVRGLSVSVSRSVSVSKTSPSAGLTDDDPQWSAFWGAYPRRVGKRDARKAWAKAIRTTDPADLVAAAQLYAEQRRGQPEQFTAHPATWLNAERWRDEPQQHPLASMDEGWWNA